MNLINIYANNASMELVALIFMLLLFCFNMILRSDRTFTKSVKYLQICVILLMLIQILQWRIGIGTLQSGEPLQIRSIQKVLFCADYALVYLFSVSFYYYLTDYIGYWRVKRSGKGSISRWGMPLRLSLGAVLVLVYIVGTVTNRLVVIQGNGETGGTMLYHILLLGLGVTYLFNAVTILHNRAVLSHVDMVVLLTFVTLPPPLIVLDLLHNTCFGYLGMGVAVVIVFLGIELYQSELLLEQEALVSHQQEELTRQKTQIMLTQIQPHFIYNTLATIDFFCETDPEEAQRLLQTFSKYLRTNMDSIDKEELIPFEKELDHIKCYLEIEQIRYDERLRVKYDIQCTDFNLPPLSVQPLVENAVRHGVRSRAKGGTVTLSTWREGSTVFVSVRDDGTGFDPEKVKSDGRNHIGMANITQRLKILCGADVLLDTGPTGTNITIRMEENRK